MGIGKRLREARDAKHLSQKQLAEMVGVTANAISNYETELSHPKEPVMYRLLEVLEVDANYLFQDCYNNVAEGKDQLPLSPEETALIAAFRVADPADQEAVRALLSKYKPASARKNTKNAVG